MDAPANPPAAACGVNAALNIVKNASPIISMFTIRTTIPEITYKNAINGTITLLNFPILFIPPNIIMPTIAINTIPIINDGTFPAFACIAFTIVFVSTIPTITIYDNTAIIA